MWGRFYFNCINKNFKFIQSKNMFVFCLFMFIYQIMILYKKILWMHYQRGFDLGLMLGLTFSTKLDWGSYIISIAKTASWKIGALILYKSTIRPCMEYCCHVWAGTLSCDLECCAELLVLHLLLLLNPWLIVEIWSA